MTNNSNHNTYDLATKLAVLLGISKILLPFLF